MAHLKLFDVDKKFSELSFVPFIGNSFNLDSQEDKNKFNELVYTHYDGESLKLTPSCECGRIKAEYRIGELCDHCGTVCASKYSGIVDVFLCRFRLQPQRIATQVYLFIAFCIPWYKESLPEA